MSKVREGYKIVNGVEITEMCSDKIRICAIQKKVKYHEMIAIILEKAMRTKSFDEIEI